MIIHARDNTDPKQRSCHGELGKGRHEQEGKQQKGMKDKEEDEMTGASGLTREG